MIKRYILIVSIALIIILTLTTIQTDMQNSASARVLHWGTTGDDVIKVQVKLKQWGYYDGIVDGIFGTGTSNAVKKFQRKNGLAVDGVVGKSTAAALGITLAGSRAASTTYNSSRGTTRQGDIYLLAAAVHGEARGEPYIGKVAVAAVILNRVRSAKFPNTIPGVIYQPGAFTAVMDGQINIPPDQESLRAARDALNGWDPSGGALYYYNPAKTTNKWIWSRPVFKVIGKHRFAK
ncbi:MAG: spore cortex-lytic enzyme [Clostridia bacterium]|nr:spore cortex-lytic enzyme [Clostridia bacterium]